MLALFFSLFARAGRGGEVSPCLERGDAGVPALHGKTRQQRGVSAVCVVCSLLVLVLLLLLFYLFPYVAAVVVLSRSFALYKVPTAV